MNDGSEDGADGKGSENGAGGGLPTATDPRDHDAAAPGASPDGAPTGLSGAPPPVGAAMLAGPGAEAPPGAAPSTGSPPASGPPPEEGDDSPPAGVPRPLGFRRWAAFALGAAALLGALAALLFHRHARPSPKAPGPAASTAPAPSADRSRAEDGAAPDADVDASVEAGPPRPTLWRVAQLAGDPKVKIVQGSLSERPLLVALAAAGLSHGETYRVTKSLAQVRDVNHLGAKDDFTIARDLSTGRVLAFEISSSPTDVWQGREEALDGGASVLESRKLDLHTERTRIGRSVSVGRSVRASIAEAGIGGGGVDELVRLFDDALDGHVELCDLRPGARLRLVATEEKLEGQFLRWASLDAVEVLPAAPSAAPVRVYWFGDEAGDKHHGWYDAKGREPFHGGWRTPVSFVRIASRFNPHRMHPILHVVMPHTGVDFAAPVGTPVYSTAAGVVVSVGSAGPCGNRVEIQHSWGITSVYCHLSRFASGLHVGQRVESRELIAYVGATGRVTGPHLHFGIKRNGVFVDPLSLHLDGARLVPKAKRAEFDARRSSLDAELDAIAWPAPSPGPSAPDDAGMSSDALDDDSR